MAGGAAALCAGSRKCPPPLGKRLDEESAGNFRGYLHISGCASLLEGGDASKHTLFLIVYVYIYA